MHARLWHCDGSGPRSTPLRATASVSDLLEHPDAPPTSFPAAALLQLYHSYPAICNRRKSIPSHLPGFRLAVRVRSVADQHSILAATGPALMPSPALMSRTIVQPVALL